MKAYFNIALILDCQGNTKQAVQFYEKAFAKRSAVGEDDHMCLMKVATNLAVCYEKVGERKKALQVYEKMR